MEHNTTNTTQVEPGGLANISSSTIFFDVETVPLWDVQEKMRCIDDERREYENYEDFGDMPPAAKEIWKKRYWEKNEISKMWLYPEFAKVVCISAGYYMPDGSRKMATWANDDEKTVLEWFAKVLEKAYKVVWHNAINFDAPFLERRYIINGMTVPNVIRGTALDDKGLYKPKKPWDVRVEDTMLMRKTTAWSSSGLETICLALGIPSPKTDMDGSKVAEKYYASVWSWGMLDLFYRQIKDYCEKDVDATMQVYRKILSCYN